MKKLPGIITCLIIAILFASCKKKSGDDDCPVCPVVTSLSPAHGHKGDTVTIIGNNFGSSAINDIVKFNGTAVDASDMISATETEIKVIVPPRCGTGPVTVTIDADLYSDGGPVFTYETTQVVSLYAGVEGVAAWSNTPVPLTSAQFTGISKILIDQAGIMTVVDSNRHRVKKFDPSVNMFRDITPMYYGVIYDIALDNNNNLYIARESSGGATSCDIYRCLSGAYTSVWSRFFTLPSGGTLVRSIGVDNQANIYCEIIGMFGDASDLLRVRPSASGGADSVVFSGPNMPAICVKNNDMYIYCEQWIGVGSDPTLRKLDLTTYTPSTVVTTPNCNNIYCQAMTLKGTVPYVTDGANIYYVNSASVLTVYPTPSLTGISGFAFDQAGDLYVAGNNCIKKISVE